MASAQLTAPAATPVPRPRRTWFLAGGVVFGLLLAGGLAAGTIPRLTRDRAVLEQARATLIQDKANLAKAKAQEIYALAQVKREEKAYKAGAESREVYDSAVAAAGVATATVKASEATLKVDEANILRLETLQSF